MTDELQQAPELDIAKASAEIAESLNLSPAPEEPEVPQEEKPAPAEEAAPPAAPVVPEAKPAETPAPEADATPAPHTWRRDAKEAWAQVPPVVREEIVKREKDIQSYVEQVKPQVALATTFEKIVSPYLEMFSKANINVFQNYEATLQVQKVLAFGSPQEKMTLIAELAKNAGLQLDGTQLSAPPEAGQAYVAQLEARLAKLEGGFTQVHSTVQEARLQELETGIMAFLQDTEAHPYGVELADDITRIIEKGLATNLEEAYQLAVQANPITRKRSFDAEVAKQLQSRTAADSARADAARKAAGANVKSNGSRRTPPPVGDIDDTLKDALAAIHARDS